MRRLKRGLILQHRNSEAKDELGISRIATQRRRLPIDFRAFFLTAPRAHVMRTVDARCVDMVRRGLLSETLDLKERWGFNLEWPSGRSIGYYQALLFLDEFLRQPVSMAIGQPRFSNSSGDA